MSFLRINTYCPLVPWVVRHKPGEATVNWGYYQRTCHAKRLTRLKAVVLCVVGQLVWWLTEWMER